MSIRAAREKLLRWERYTRRYEKLLGTGQVFCTPAHLRAYDQFARAVNSRNHLKHG